MRLYDYQIHAIDAIINNPSPSQIISMPTGTGKTVTFLSCLKTLNKPSLVLVHRQELLEQTKDKALKVGFTEEQISIISAGDKASPNFLTIAMVPTLVRHLDKYNPQDIVNMVIDEAHHASAPSYQKIIHYFGVGKEGKLLLGFTATPLRGDGKALSHTFASHSYKMTLSEATQLGYICPVYGLRVDIDMSIDKIQKVAGDYDSQELDRVMNCEEVNTLIANKCQNLKKTPGIIFCTSVDHAQKIAKKLRLLKRKAISISYKTPKKTLTRIYKLLSENRIEFITNAVKLSEGFDHPAISSVILARPTCSPVLYKQMIGRGLRNHPDKDDCLVMEFSGNDEKMIRWEDIDQNCTFQCVSSAEMSCRETALNTMKSKFSRNVNILDVRVSPIAFYECFVRRVVKYKDFYFVPDSKGFTLFQMVPSEKSIGHHKFRNIYGWAVFWKDVFKSFYIWSEAYLFYEEFGRDEHQLKDIINHYINKQGAGSLGKWYPSEYAMPDTKHVNLWKSLGCKGSDIPKNARKFMFDLEDRIIKKIIDQYWISNNSFPVTFDGAVHSSAKTYDVPLT